MGYSPWGRRVGHNLATKQQQHYGYTITIFCVCYKHFLLVKSFFFF